MNTSKMPVVGEIWYNEGSATPSCEIIAVTPYGIQIRTSLGKTSLRRIGTSMNGKMALVPRCHMASVPAIYVRECDLGKSLAEIKSESKARGDAWNKSLNSQ